MFVHLKFKSEYSICKSTLRIKDAVKSMKAMGFKAAAICDEGNCFGGLEFGVEAAKAGLVPIMGASLKLKIGQEVWPVSIFAGTAEGYKNLLNITSTSLIRDEEKWTVLWDDFAPHTTGLMVLCGVANAGIFAKLREALPQRDIYVEISRYLRNKAESEREDELLKIALDFGLPIIGTNDSYFQNPEMFEAQDILKCVGEGRFQIEDDREKLTPNHYLKSPEELSQLFADLPEAIENANNFMKRVSFAPKYGKPMLPTFAENEYETLCKEAYEGLERRISLGEILGLNAGYTRDDYIKQLEYEIEVIKNMGFCGYFLIVSDFIKWSKTEGIPVGPGRGSGAGSLVAYCLYITDVDPLYYGLLFERFLNPERVSMPDFDIDFCQEGRGRVISYVRRKYGESNVAAIITFGKLQARAVLKDVGRVLQVPYAVVDRICKMIPFNPVDPVTLEKAIEMDPDLQAKREEDDITRKLIDISLKLEGTNRHFSTHAAGIIIADRPLIDAIPLIKTEGDELPAVGYHMKAAENAGLVKFDFLGLKTLTVIANVCRMVKENHGVEIDISKIPLNDEKTFALLQKGLTLGIFQLESLVCRDSMKKMKIDKIEDIIALTSLNRPGPMENIPSYVNRKLGREAVTYPHKLLESLLKETYGIIIYQEQVIKIAQILGGYSLGQADLLRRAMGKKIKEEMEAQRRIFVDGAKAQGVEEKRASEIFDLVEKFAGYGFNKSHAAAYSVISYQTAYLKAHFPVEFLIANLNISIADTDDISLFINDAKQLEIPIHLPCVNASMPFFSISKDKKGILYALGALKGVGLASMAEMCEIREKGGAFRDIFDFCKRTGNKIANKKQLESLAKSGAFAGIGANAKQIVESVEVLTQYAAEASKPQNSAEFSLFGEEDSGATLPKLAATEDFNENEKLGAEFESVGFYLSFHPILKYTARLKACNFAESRQVEALVPEGKQVNLRMAGVISIVKQRSGPRGRFAFVYLSDSSGIFETSIFKEEIITQNREILVSGKIVAVECQASKQENGSFRLAIQDIEEIESKLKKIENDPKLATLAQPKQWKKRETYAPKADMPFDGPYEPQAPAKNPLEEASELETLRILVKNAAEISLKKLAAELKSSIDENGKTKVFLHVEDRVIALPKAYSVSQLIVERLKASEGIFEIIS